MKRSFLILAMGLLATVSAVGCQTAYFGAMEKMGFHKREILIDRVKGARDSQEEAKEQFQSALERFCSIIQVDGGDLEKKYDLLSVELTRNEARAKEVHDRIGKVEDVAGALFREWRNELGQYTNAGLRRESERKLEQTEAHYRALLMAMKQAESKMEPVLQPFRDQVLFLKHNLNARAITSLQGELATIQSDVTSLIRDLERSITEADRFISNMGESQ